STVICKVKYVTISSQASIMGDLQRLLSQGEYAPFTSAPIFESKFVQVNQRGEPISVHNRASCVTIGICAANPSSPMPNVMLVARPTPVIISGQCNPRESPCVLNDEFPLFFIGFFPLKFVELSVHSTDKHHLMLKLANGRSYYLELCAPPDQQQHLFHLWLQLISLLKPPENTSNTEKVLQGNARAGSQTSRSQPLSVAKKETRRTVRVSKNGSGGPKENITYRNFTKAHKGPVNLESHLGRNLDG
uniref:Golgi associated RAB2 interactor protein-like Rab2B-binding domain-containing protein n=1 Tax=Aquila chrysaetos chrysaetos TaxID=223781 RepID=A0A663E0V4_AQUCH